MEKILNRYIIIVLILALTAIIVNHLEYNPFNDQNEGMAAIQSIPKTIGDWKGTDYELEPVIFEILETKSIIHRNYQSHKGDNVFLSLVFYPDTKVDFHAPEGCLAGSGETIFKSPQVLKIKSGNSFVYLKINKLVAISNGKTKLVYYFYKAGPYIGRSYIALRLNIAFNKLFSANTSGALIRVSTNIRNKDLVSESEALMSFIEYFIPYLKKYI